MKILVAEEDEAVRKPIYAAVRRLGHEPTDVADGEAAIQAIDKEDCRLLIADAHFKRTNCLELIRTIRSQRHNPYVYSILLVDHYRSSQIVAGITAGFDDFLTRPPDEAELMARLRFGERIAQINSRASAVFALARIAETRRCRGGRHLERLKHYCRCLAEKLHDEVRCRREVDPKYVRQLLQMCTLHDIGNFCIPDNILLKPGRLNKDEFDVVKNHPLAGATITDALSQNTPERHLPRMAHDIVIAHHECWDGHGYPRGLAGESIPLAARIVALADVYDALTTKQVYRDALSHTQAREIIDAESGTHLDPGVVEAFHHAESKFMKIRWQLNDATAAHEALVHA